MAKNGPANTSELWARGEWISFAITSTHPSPHDKTIIPYLDTHSPPGSRTGWEATEFTQGKVWRSIFSLARPVMRSRAGGSCPSTMMEQNWPGNRVQPGTFACVSKDLLLCLQRRILWKRTRQMLFLFCQASKSGFTGVMCTSVGINGWTWLMCPIDYIPDKNVEDVQSIFTMNIRNVRTVIPYV